MGVQPGMFSVGQLYGGGMVNGQQVWSQPGGIGTQVFPAYPRMYPVQPEKPQSFPQTPFVFYAQLNFGCGHWANSPTVFKVYDPYTQEQAALCCCPQCGYIQLIVEPAEDWWEKFYLLYNQGLITGIRPTW
jgi:hypothetical protein